jgi:hypothetical protein
MPLLTTTHASLCHRVRPIIQASALSHTHTPSLSHCVRPTNQVSALFADHPDLLKEFTFFLPDAVQVCACAIVCVPSCVCVCVFMVGLCVCWGGF